MPFDNPFALSVRDCQRLYAAAGYYNGAIDGDAGPKTHEAAEKIMSNHPSRIPGGKLDDGRKLVIAAQLVLHFAGHEPGDIDGYAWHNTSEAFNSWEYERDHGRKQDLGRDTDVFRKDTKADKAKSDWPRQKDMMRFYGNVGTNQVTLQLPYAMRLAWDVNTTVNTTQCHEKVHDAMEAVFDRVLDAYGDKIKTYGLDLWGGCLNVRKMRGGSSWSTHSWGIAWDLDPANNRLRWNSTRARFAQPKYDKYWKIVEDAGALSLGRARDFDWMHAQFARL